MWCEVWHRYGRFMVSICNTLPHLTTRVDLMSRDRRAWMRSRAFAVALVVCVAVMPRAEASRAASTRRGKDTAPTASKDHRPQHPSVNTKTNADEAARDATASLATTEASMFHDTDVATVASRGSMATTTVTTVPKLATDEAFEAFVHREGKAKEYCGDDASYPCRESERRKQIFMKHMEAIDAMYDSADLGSEGGRRSRGSLRGAEYKPTLWSDRTDDEFERWMGRLIPTPDGERERSRMKHDAWMQMHEQFISRNEDIWSNERDENGAVYDKRNVPSNWDWREIGGLSQVWEQGACGGCWAFTTAAAIEGVHYIWTKEKVTLSPQMLLECDPIDQDCVGGNMVTGYQYAVMKGGVPSADDYPLHPYTLETSMVGPCRKNTARKHAASIDDYIILENTWDALKSAIYMQPVSVAVNALSPQFRFYSGGILTYDDCQPDWQNSPNLINHAVVAVGFGRDEASGLDYVVIKNSWGRQWGENGYARISMEGAELNATCGLLIESVAPLKLSNLTYSDPDYDPSVDDFIDWAPHGHLGPVTSILYLVLTVVVLVACLSMAIMTVISCMTEDDDGYYYTDLDYEDYDKRFDVRRAGRIPDDVHPTARHPSRFSAHREPITGLTTQGPSGRDPRERMENVKPHRGAAL